MKKFLLFSLIFVLFLSLRFYPIIKNIFKSRAHPTNEIIATNKELIDPPDVLSATNLEQWKSLIKDLKYDKFTGTHWTTARFRAGSPPVLLKYNGQSIVFKASCIDAMVLFVQQNYQQLKYMVPI